MKNARNPIILYILQAICILIALNRIMVTVYTLRRMNSFSLSEAIPALITVLWILACIGLVLKKRWGWGLFLGNTIFMILTIINSLLFIKRGLTFGIILPTIVGILIIIMLNRKHVLTIYAIESNKDVQTSVMVVQFAVICISCGFYLLTESFLLDQLTTSDLMAKLYIITIGLIGILAGIGVWNGKLLPYQAMLPLLLFICLSASYILLKDLMSDKGYFSFAQGIFYIALSVGFPAGWIFITRKRIRRVKNQNK